MPSPRYATQALALLLTAGLFATAACSSGGPPGPITGQLNWRGDAQNGTSPQTNLPTSAVTQGDAANLRWTLDVPGGGTPAIAEYDDGPRMFVLGYPGEDAELTETLYCLDPQTGEEIWSRSYSDFISDIIYNRYAIGGPTVDPETGNVFIHTSPGLLVALDRDGNELWQVSLMEQYGRLTFPNGRTGVVTVDGDLAIVNIISTNWGSEGPARNRFYAFDKNNGQLVWSSTPGVGPPFLRDSSFSTPMIEDRRGSHVFYAGTGCGNLVCVNAIDGSPIWRYQMSYGGVNSSPVVYDNGTPTVPVDDLVIQIHGKENIDDTGRGYMIAVRADYALVSSLGEDELPQQLGDEFVAWRNDDVSMFTSSPTLVDGTVYQCTADGYLVAIDASTGITLWQEKLGASQLHASPLYADGRLYVPYWNDGLYIVEPGREGPRSVQHTELQGACVGTPTAWNGKLYIHTTDRLYCFGNEEGGTLATAESTGEPDEQTAPDLSTATQARVIPAEFLLRPGESLTPTTYMADEQGRLLTPMIPDSVGYLPWIPPTARVQSTVNATVDGGTITATQENVPSAGAYQASVSGLDATFRGRVLPVPPYEEDFQGFELSETDVNDNVPYAHPPLPWLGARMKWQVRVDPTDPDNYVLAKTLDRVLFQRSMIFMGHPDDSGYTVTADVMTDGNRRLMSVVGVINQRYIIALDANKQAIEVTSNPNRIAETADFSIQPDTWYTLRTTVQVNDDGSGVVYGRAWPRGEEEPDEWTIAVDVPTVHTQGSPGIYGFSPQSRFRVFVDNVSVTPNE